MTTSQTVYTQNAILQSLKQPLTEQEYRALEEDISVHGCLTPLLIWDNCIIDGSKRYELCRLLGIPFPVTCRNFTGLPDAVSFVCQTQLKREDLTPEMRKYLIGQQYHADLDIRVRECLKLFPAAYGQKQVSLPAKPQKKYETAHAVGAQYCLAAGTVLKYGRFAKNIDLLRGKNGELAACILSSALAISLENVGELAKLPVCALNRLKEKTDGNCRHIRYDDIRQEQHCKTPVPFRPKFAPQIHNLPAYDPDAGVSSLALTIPSWVSSIAHVEDHAALEHISPAAKQKAKTQLCALRQAADRLYRMLDHA